MKALAGGLLLSLVCPSLLVGQERDRSLERLTLALQQPIPILRGVDPVETRVRRSLGVLTLVPPELPGEMVRVSGPIGALVSRVIRGVGGARQRREAEAARRRVEAALTWLADQQASSQR